MFWSTASAEHLYGLYEYLNKNTSFGLGKKNAVFGTWIHHLYEMPNMWDQKPPYQGRYENYSYCEGYCHRFMPYWVCYVFNTYFDFLCLFNYSQSFMIWRNRHVKKNEENSRFRETSNISTWEELWKEEKVFEITP